MAMARIRQIKKKIVIPKRGGARKQWDDNGNMNI